MDIQNFYNLGSLINLILIIATTVGSIYVFRNSVIKATEDLADSASALQNNAIHAMKEEISTLKDKINDLTVENKKLSQTISTIISAFKKQNILITIDGELIHISTSKDGTLTMTRREEDEHGNHRPGL